MLLHRTSVLSLLVLVPVSSAFAIGCSGASAAESTDSAADLLVADDALAGQIEVKADELRVGATGHESLLSRTRGSYLVAQPRGNAATSKNPYGFLRRVESVGRDGGDIVVRTSAASVAEVAPEGEAHSSMRLSEAAANSLSGGDLALQDLHGLPWSGVDVSGSVLLFDKGPASGTATYSIAHDIRISKGTITFDPSLDISLHVHRGKIQEFHVIASGSVAADVEIDASITANGEIDLSDPSIFTKEFKTNLFTSPSFHLPPQFVGVVPVVESVSVTVAASCKLTAHATASAHFGATASSEVVAGAKYENGAWAPVTSANFQFAPVKPVVNAEGDVQLRCSLEPQVQVLFYDAAGPTITIAPYAEVDASDTNGKLDWNVHVGVDGRAGGEIKILGHEIAAADLKLFNFQYDKPIAGGSL